MINNNITGIYYNANENSDYFMNNTQRILLEAVGDMPIISVSFKPTRIGQNCTNIVVGEGGRSNYKLYHQILIGAKAAKTNYWLIRKDKNKKEVVVVKRHIPLKWTLKTK